MPRFADDSSFSGLRVLRREVIGEVFFESEDHLIEEVLNVVFVSEVDDG